MNRIAAISALAAPLLVACQVGGVISNSGGDDTDSADAAPMSSSDGSPEATSDAAPTSSADATPVSPLLPGWCNGQPANFSFFVTSMNALWALSESTPGDLNGGFGGDFGGLAGADAICQTIATATGHGDKTWRAFLSATDDGTGSPVNAIDRIGTGPWYDANGRQVATGIAGLAGERPDGDVQSTDDLPDECGVPLSALGDAHDVPTGSNLQGQLASTDPSTTCNDWTSTSATVGSSGLMCGHAFPRSATSGRSWVSDHQLRGCAKGANLAAGSTGSCIGCTGGYGAIYCFGQ